MWSLLKRASAFVPLAISGLLLVLILIYVARMGGVRLSDEGAEAQLFQLLMPVQVLVIVFFAWKWLPRNPRAARQILALQISAVVTLLVLVRLLRL
jgi:hypothetical protein